MTNGVVVIFNGINIIFPLFYNRNSVQTMAIPLLNFF